MLRAGVGVGGVDEAILGGVAVAVVAVAVAVRQDDLAGRGGPVLPPAVLFPAIIGIVRTVLPIVAPALQQPAALGAVDPQLGQVGVGVAQAPEGGAAPRVRVLDAVQAGRAGAVGQVVPAGRLGRREGEAEGGAAAAGVAVAGGAEQRQKGGGGRGGGLVRWSSGARPLPALLPPSRAAVHLSHVGLVRVKPDAGI